MNALRTRSRSRILLFGVLLAAALGAEAQEAPARAPRGTSGTPAQRNPRSRSSVTDPIASIPGLTERQEAAIRTMNDHLAPLAQDLAEARTSLDITVNSGRNDAELLRKRVDAVSAAELALAQARADAMARLQSSANKLDDDQLTALFRTRQGAPARLRLATGRTPPAQGGLDNFGLVNERILRGAQPNANAIESLKAMGVTTIINLVQTDHLWTGEQAEAARHGILYTNVPMRAVGRPTTDQVNTALSIITNAPGKVFLHCLEGRDRTGTVAACYRIVHDGWTGEQALREAEQFNMARAQVEMKEFIIDYAKARPTPSPAP